MAYIAPFSDPLLFFDPLPYGGLYCLRFRSSGLLPLDSSDFRMPTPAVASLKITSEAGANVCLSDLHYWHAALKASAGALRKDAAATQ
jgi:hypothetical protein